jgi:hypothetical protein
MEVRHACFRNASMELPSSTHRICRVLDHTFVLQRWSFLGYGPQTVVTLSVAFLADDVPLAAVGGCFWVSVGKEASAIASNYRFTSLNSMRNERYGCI